MRSQKASLDQSQNLVSISNPAVVEYFNPGGLVDISGVSVNERSALGLSALFRAVALISGTLASLPLKSHRTNDQGRPEQVASIFDNPDGDEGQTPFEWKESAFLHLLLHGKAGALKVRNEAGGLIRLPLVHPLSFRIEPPTLEEQREPELMPVGGSWFIVQLDDGNQVKLDSRDFWYVPSMSLDGVNGISLITTARMSLGTSIAGDKAAAKMFSNGALISGLVTPVDEADITEDVPEIRRQLNSSVTGYENAGAIAVVNRRLAFTPWTMKAVDAQFLESRQFQIEEVSRWTGVPPHLLMQMDKQTSWGTGVDEQNRGLSKFVLGHWAQRFEQRASRLLARPRWCEFDWAGLERPNFATEVDLLIKQVQAGLLTVNEARAIRNLPPLPEAKPDAVSPPPSPQPDDNPKEDSDA